MGLRGIEGGFLVHIPLFFHFDQSGEISRNELKYS